MTATIDSVIFQFGQGANGFLLVQFLPGQHNQPVLITPNISVQIMNFLQQQLNNVSGAVINANIIPALCNFLDHSFNFLTSRNVNNAIFHSKLAIMVIDEDLNVEINSLTLSDELKKRGIILAVVAAGTPVFKIWDIYRTVAHNTGGEIMLLADAPVILENVISSFITSEDTLRQAFRHINTNGFENLAIPNGIGGVNEQNKATDGVGDMLFNHGESQ